jgi:hypothetical protein
MGTLDICGQRLANQLLGTRKLEKASEIVELLGAVQAQDYSAAKWGLAQRSHGLTDAQIEKQITDGAILRTHVLRPTWHFVGPADIRWMLALTAPRVRAAMASYDRKLELDAAVLRKSNTLLTKALRDGKQLTRTELSNALTKGGVRSDGTQRLAHLMMHAELDGLVCNGARRGNQFTYALLDERVPPAKEISRDESLHALATRYFATRGPATEDDFAWWSGLTKGDARRAALSAESSLEQAVVGGRRYWYRLNATAAKPKSLLARLLPNYDEFFIGLKDRTAIQTKLGTEKVQTGISYLRGHIATISGQVVGGWERTFKGASVVVTVRPLMRLSRVERDAISREAMKFAKFLQLPGRIEIHDARP